MPFFSAYFSSLTCNVIFVAVVVVLCAVLIIGHKVRILLHFHSAAVAINLQGAFLAAVDVHVVLFVVLFAVVVVF